VSPDKRINDQFEALPQINSTLLYEFSGVSSSATGECIGSFQVRWYGTAMNAEDIKKEYSGYLADNGWKIRLEEVVEIWSLETDDGLYRLGTSIFTNPDSISQEQGSYRLPDSILYEANRYHTVYTLSMVYASPYVAKKCSGH